jgi:hypothetical protein
MVLRIKLILRATDKLAIIEPILCRRGTALRALQDEPERDHLARGFRDLNRAVR